MNIAHGFSYHFTTYEPIRIQAFASSNHEEQKICCVKQLGQLYECLCDIMDSINLIHSFTVWTFGLYYIYWNWKGKWWQILKRFQILIRTAITFVASINGFYSLCQYLMSDDNGALPSEIVIRFNGIVYHLLNLLAIIHYGSQVTRKVLTIHFHSTTYLFIHHFDWLKWLPFFLFTERRYRTDDL